MYGDREGVRKAQFLRDPGRMYYSSKSPNVPVPKLSQSFTRSTTDSYLVSS